MPASQLFTSSTDFCASLNREPTFCAEKIAAEAVSVTAPLTALAYTVVLVMFSSLNGPPDGDRADSTHCVAPSRDSLRGA